MWGEYVYIQSELRGCPCVGFYFLLQGIEIIKKEQQKLNEMAKLTHKNL